MKPTPEGSLSVPFIPKRGEKDFAPLEGSQSRQAAALQESRSAMYTALRLGQTRTHNSKSYNKATWHPELARASMSVEGVHGIHFQTMGRYIAQRQRIELLPEELLYLVERGALECWTEEGVPMSAQHVFMVAFTSGILTFEQYQVRISFRDITTYIR